MTLHIPTPLIESRRCRWLPGATSGSSLTPCSLVARSAARVGHACEVHYARVPGTWCRPRGNAGLAVAYAGRNWGAGDRGGARDHHRTGQELLRLENAKVLVRQLVAGSQRTGTDPGRRWRCLHSPLRRPAAVGRACQPGRRSGCGFKPDAVVLSGVAALSGVVEGLQRNGWADVPVLAVETTGAASLHAAMQAGHTVALPRIASIAGSLGAKRVAEQALACTHRQPVHSHLVSDRAALQACERFLQDHRLLVEPACGAALALA